MNNVVLNIRGAHCSGKTTAVRLFIEKHSHEVTQEMVKGRKTALTVINGGEIVVLGRYDQGACGGCDRFKGGGHVKAALAYVAERYHPRAIVYEGIMYSVTYKMATEIANFANALGYEWRSVYLSRSWEESLKLLSLRNGGKQVNTQAVIQKLKLTATVYEKLNANGYNVKKVNVTGTSLEELGKVVGENIGV